MLCLERMLSTRFQRRYQTSCVIQDEVTNSILTILQDDDKARQRQRPTTFILIALLNFIIV